MIGYLIVTHESIGQELIKAVEVISGKQELLEAICFLQKESIMQLREKITKKIKSLDQGKGVIIFTDLLGGSCTNLSYEIKSKEENKIKIITGVSLNMILDAVFERPGRGINKLAEILYKSSRKATVLL